jgi:hypothetical protein
MTLEWLGEVFKGDSADTCAGKFPLVSMGGRANGQACADSERGPPSARAEISNLKTLAFEQKIERISKIYKWETFAVVFSNLLFLKDVCN